MTITKYLTLAFLGLSAIVQAQVSPTEVVLDGKSLEFRSNVSGGAITSIRLKSANINPLSWSLTKDQMPKNNQAGTPFAGHFLCLNRWGAPSDPEIEAGIPHNGDIHLATWLVSPIDTNGGMLSYSTTTTSEREMTKLTRTVRMPQITGFVLVSEAMQNTGVLGRVTNMVQHPTIGPPFLTSQTILSSNADLGFDQATDPKLLVQKEFTWPMGKLESGPADLTKTNDERGYVTSHIFSKGQKYAWVTAIDPNTNVLFGYLWKAEDYPWLNVWHYADKGKPVAQGLEFGTAGLGKPYSYLLANDVNFHGRHSFEYIEAKETKVKSYLALLFKVPPTLRQVASIDIVSGSIMLKGKDGASMMIPLQGLKF